MSGSLPQLQEQAATRADEFCARYGRPRRTRGSKGDGGWSDDSIFKRTASAVEKFYRPRDPEASPLYQVVRDHFDEFRRVYPERYEKRYGYWRPIIGTSIEKFLRCGDLKYGFARVRCPDCKVEYHVAFSCRQRGCCPSCDQKRALMLAQRLNAEVFADVPHRQWVFTIPRRLRVYFLYDRSLLGRLCRAAYETLREVVALEVGDEDAVPAMVTVPQSHGDLANWNSHVHAIAAEGAFTRDGRFVPMPHVWMQRAEDIWRDQVFALLLDTHKIDQQLVASMLSWRHSGFSVHAGVRIAEGDHEGMSRVVGYIARSPLSLSRLLFRTQDGKVVYRASHGKCWPFPKSGQQTIMEGIPRNHEIFDPLDFLAEVTQHIPNKGEHQIRYYGWYSNKLRGMRAKAQQAVAAKPRRHLTPEQLKRRLTWASLIKLVYEADPLRCPNCGGTMRVVSMIDADRQPDVVQKILRHCGLWKDSPKRGPPQLPDAQRPAEPDKLVYDETYFDRECC